MTVDNALNYTMAMRHVCRRQRILCFLFFDIDNEDDGDNHFVHGSIPSITYTFYIPICTQSSTYRMDSNTQLNTPKTKRLRIRSKMETIRHSKAIVKSFGNTRTLTPTTLSLSHTHTNDMLALLNNIVNCDDKI